VEHRRVDDEELMPIGALARLSRLSVKALRLYDAEGLLAPARVDADTGYRYYRRDQVRVAASIALLRSLDVPLGTIREMLAADDAQRLRALLASERERAARELARRRRALDALQRLMLAGELMPYEIALGEEPPLTLAAVTRAVDPERIVRDVGAMAAELARRAARGGWTLDGPWCGLYPLDLGERPSVTLGAPLAHPGRADGAEVLRVAGGPVATTLHVGSYDELPLAYAALLAWAHERGLEPDGPIRETYLSDPARAPAPELVTRISVPAAPREAR
jgi:DNA-binding transcriptional MerR regulator